ncbi:UNVERIFIED_CONTAM: hypothetical protein HDU68_006532, partial [Siphonaria sp. JEL0065]
MVLMASGFPLICFVVIAQISSMITVTSTSAMGQVQQPKYSGLQLGTKIYFVFNQKATPTAAAIMQRMCDMNGLNCKSDVSFFGSNDFDSLASDIFVNYRELSSRPTWMIVNWTGSDNAPSYAITAPTSYDIDVMMSSHVSAVQTAIDGAILSYNKNPVTFTPGSDTYKVAYDFFTPGGSDYDQFPDQSQNPRGYIMDMSWISQLLISSIGSVSFVPLMVLVVDIVVKEKQRKLYGVLRRMGLMESALWLSVFGPMILVCLPVALGASVGAYISSSVSDSFKVTFGVLFFVNFCYALAIAGFGCTISAIVTKPLHVNLAVGLVSVACIVVNIGLFTESNALMGAKPIPPGAPWYKNCNATFAKALLFIFAPFYNYARIWADVILFTNPLFSDTPSSKFDFNELVNTQRNIVKALGPNADENAAFFNVPPTVTNAFFLLLSPLLHVTLAWYLNQVIVSEEGFSSPWNFPFMITYWTGRSTKKEVTRGDTLAAEKEKSGLTNTVRLVKLTKAYQNTTAVKELSLVFESGKVYSVLGHNGAGKTSLINMLSLNTTPTFGDCFMFGMDIKEDAVQLQGMMSLCPQFDILYPSLTPFQHMEFYYNFRGDKFGSKTDKTARILEKLEGVNLADVAHIPCGRFSGGMKRRLSLCLASLSESAKIVFLDEPTTGLDPISRRGVWKVIQEMKKDKIVILTTHNMEEADELGDHVCIMHQGRLRASGSSIFLKNRFGDGFQVTVVNRNNQTKLKNNEGEAQKALEDYVKYALPKSNIVSSAGGALTVAVGKLERGRLVSFLRALKKDEKLEWTLGNATLEEVFLKLCAQNKEVATEAEGGSKKTAPICRICIINPTEPVDLYTKSGIKVEICDVLCKKCADNIEDGPDQIADKNLLEIATFGEFTSHSPNQVSQAHACANRDATKFHDEFESTLWIQVKSVFIKNMFLHGKERKTNIGFVICLVLFIVGGTLTAGLFPSPPSSCESGIWFAINSDSGYPTFSCKVSDFVTAMKGSNSYGSSDLCPNLDPNSMKIPIACSGSLKQSFSYNSRNIGVFAVPPGITSQNYYYTPQAMYVLNSTALSFMRGPTKINYIQKKVAGDVDASQLLILAPFVSMFTSYSLTNGSVLSNVSSAGLMQDYFTSQQRSLVASEASLESSCPSYPTTVGVRSPSGARGLAASSLEEFEDMWGRYYPDFGINFNRLKVDSVGVNIDLELVLYPSKKFPAIFAPASALISSFSSQLFADCAAIQYSTTYNQAGYFLDSMVVTTNSITNQALRLMSKENPKGISNVGIGVLTGFPQIYDIASDTSVNITIMFRFGSAIFTMFFLLATGLMFPRIVSLLTLEKNENLVEMMRIQGLSLPSYWLGNYTYAFSAIFIFNFIYATLCLVVGVPALSRAGVGFTLLLILVWSHGQVCLSFFIAGVIAKPVPSSLISYMLFILAAGFSPFLLLTVKSTGFGLAANIFPISGVLNLLVLMTSYAPKDGTAILANSAVLFICSTLMGLFGMYIHAIRPSKVGIAVDPLLGFGTLFNSSSPATKGQKNTVDDIDVGPKRDTDVVDHEKEVQRFHDKGTQENPSLDENEALRVVHLRKEFDGGKKVAVKDMTVSFKFGETFGLLGPNGAGKTTALSMITGLLKRTSGDIVISGKSIRHDQTAKKSQIGVTPQFDTVWPTMTVEEHLIFYCRLRGVSRRDMPGMVRSIAESIELDGDPFKKPASDLSGGMKRRLSIGIAMTGNPKILVLDEPTTGLDPETRRQIWEVVDKVRCGGEKCVLITTHSMDEADALCTRIGIVCDGGIRVLGSQMSLKKKFAEGLK